MKKINNGVFDFSTISFVDNNWFTLIMLVGLLLLTINVVVNRRKFLLAVRCIYSNRAFSQLCKEGKLFTEGSFIFSLPFILITLSLCIQQLCSRFFPLIGGGLSYMRFFGIICLAVTALFLVRQIVDFFLFELFDSPDDRYYFHVASFSFWLNISLSLLLTAVIIQYTNFTSIYWVNLLIISILFILKTYKNIVFKSQQVNLFQFFMYFCTLEILPYAVIIKLMFLYGNKGF